MGRTWYVRGITIAVCAVLAGAWTVEVSGLRDSDSPSEERRPIAPESSIPPELDPPADHEKVRSPRPTEKPRSRDSDTEPIVDADNEPTSDDPSSPASETPGPTPDSPPGPEGPSDPPAPPTPSDPPDEPSDQCTDALSVLDCVLNPVTGHPPVYPGAPS